MNIAKSHRDGEYSDMIGTTENVVKEGNSLILVENSQQAHTNDQRKDTELEDLQ
jgi:hypothetical protein